MYIFSGRIYFVCTGAINTIPFTHCFVNYLPVSIIKNKIKWSTGNILRPILYKYSDIFRFTICISVRCSLQEHSPAVDLLWLVIAGMAFPVYFAQTHWLMEWSGALCGFTSVLSEEGRKNTTIGRPARVPIMHSHAAVKWQAVVRWERLPGVLQKCVCRPRAVELRQGFNALDSVVILKNIYITILLFGPWNTQNRQIPHFHWL